MNNAIISKAATLCLTALCSAWLVVSCATPAGTYNNKDNFGEIMFVNASNCSIDISETSFSGRVLIEKLIPGGMEVAEVLPSNNYGTGTMFPIKYWCDVAKGGVYASGDIITSGIDPNAQIQQNVEAGQVYTIYVPNPSADVEYKESYVKIKNNSAMPLEFWRLSSTFKQAGNGETSIPSTKTGVYMLGTGDFEVTYYTIRQGLDLSYPFPEFTAEDGYIYNFEFDGKNIIEKERQRIGF